MSTQVGPRNPNWKGGRSVASNGYVLVKAPGHPLADVRGYVYEHRLVAERKLGRALRPDEEVHHKNRIKTDNREENLEVVTHAEHGVEHRRRERGLRMPGEPNPMVACACGCGGQLHHFDAVGRPREHIQGHNPQPREARDAIVAALATGPMHRADIARVVGRNVRATACALSALKREGRVEMLGHGVWRLR